jgi:mRNA-degrading endonuclease RelE of RelBE toxin-antitoxin system
LPYVIEYSPEAEDHMRWLTTRQQRTVLDTVDRQLLHQPAMETRNRKPMRPNPVAPWELRIGDLRVYYETKDEPEPTVTVLAIGIKEKDQVRIGGERFKL